MPHETPPPNPPATDPPPGRPVAGCLTPDGAAAPPGLDRASPAELLEAILADQQERWERGECVTAAAYLERYPALRAEPEQAADVVYQEYVLRAEGDAPDLFADYLRQFPEYAAPLQRLYEADRFVGSALLPRGPEGLGKRFGNYELLEEIGRGGMGIVWKARQVGLGRVVALKMILTGELASPDDIERFRNESRAAAALDHPNIVAVHEVGEHGGQPYFSMDFVAGRSLADVVREGPLPASRAAEYIRAVAAAVQHAHDKGILHRDLKPANILIGAEDQPRVMDFGLARPITGSAGLTGTGQVLGSPPYMPPEQASGRKGGLTPASDVYALGAVLYELLTGRPPFQAETPLDTLLLVLETEPVAPRLLNPRMLRDLETICLKCLHKDPKKRYASASALAEELGCFLRGEPIQARPVSFVERAWRWCKRKPVLAGTLATLVLVIAGGLGGVLWQWARAEQKSTEAREERDTAKRERERAEAYFQDSQEVVRSMLSHVGNERLRDVPQMEPLRRELLEEALAFDLKFLQERGDDPAVRFLVGQAHRQVGYIRETLGELPAAEKAYRQAIERHGELAAAFPDRSEYQKALLGSYSELARVLLATGQFAEAEGLHRQLQTMLERLVADHPGEPDYLQALAVFSDNEAQRLQVDSPASPGRLAEAEQWCLKSLTLRKQLVKEFPQDWQYRKVLAGSYNHLGVIQRKDQRYLEAQAAYRQALELRRQLVAERPTQAALRCDVGMTWRNLGILLRTQRRNDDAAESFREARKVLERVVEDFPSTPFYRSELAETLHGLGLLLQQAGKPAEAREALEAAIQQQKLVVQFNPKSALDRRKLSNQFFCLADVLLELKEHGEASKAALGAVRTASERVLDYLDPACLLANCVLLAEKDETLPEEKRKEVVQAYVRQAVEVLREGQKTGYIRFQDLKAEPALNPLRSHEEFTNLLSELEKEAGK
jgi:eukaryotic-like serine/threonine-protein kinase